MLFWLHYFGVNNDLDPLCTVFHDEQAAYDVLEACIWSKGAVCVHCGGMERVEQLAGKSTRIGVYKCFECRKPFTVKVGTIFESSHIPMRLWLQAISLLASSKKGISSNQLHRTLGITLHVGVVHEPPYSRAMKDGV